MRTVHVECRQVVVARPAARLQMAEPALTQSLEATPAIGGAQRHTLNVAEFTVKVSQIALRVIDGAHRHVGQLL